MKKQSPSSSTKRNISVGGKTSGGTGGGFIGFSAFATSSSGASPVKTVNAGASASSSRGIDGGGNNSTTGKQPDPIYTGNISLLRSTFAKLRKKDPITKVKALTSLVSSTDEDGIFSGTSTKNKQEIVQGLTHYTFVFHNTTPAGNKMYPHNGCLVYDNTASVRVAALEVWLSVIPLIPKAAKSLLLFSTTDGISANSLGTIYMLCYDSNRETSNKAKEVWNVIETTLFSNSKEKMKDAVLLHLITILSNVKPPVVSKSSASNEEDNDGTSYFKERYDRVILSTLDSLGSLINHYPEQIEKKNSNYINFLPSYNPKCIWKHIANPNEPTFRNSTYRLISSCIKNATSLIHYCDVSKKTPKSGQTAVNRKETSTNAPLLMSTLLVTAISFEKHPNNINVLLEAIVLYVRYLKQKQQQHDLITMDAGTSESSEYEKFCQSMIKPLINKQLRKLCHGCLPRLWCPLLLPLLLSLPESEEDSNEERATTKILQGVWDGMTTTQQHGDGISIVTAISECCTFMLTKKNCNTDSKQQLLKLFHYGFKWYLDTCPVLEQRTKQLAAHLAKDYITIAGTFFNDDSSKMEHDMTQLLNECCQFMFVDNKNKENQTKQQRSFESKLVLWLKCLVKDKKKLNTTIMHRGLCIIFDSIRAKNKQTSLPKFDDAQCLLEILKFCDGGMDTIAGTTIMTDQKTNNESNFSSLTKEPSTTTTLERNMNEMSLKETSEGYSDNGKKFIETFIMNDILKWTIVLGRFTDDGTSTGDERHHHHHHHHNEREETIQLCFTILYHILMKERGQMSMLWWEAFIRECIKSKCHIRLITLGLQTISHLLQQQYKNNITRIDINNPFQCQTLDNYAMEVGNTAEDIYLIVNRHKIDIAIAAERTSSSKDNNYNFDSKEDDNNTIVVVEQSTSSSDLHHHHEHHLKEIDEFLRACCCLSLGDGSSLDNNDNNNIITKQVGASNQYFISNHVIEQWIVKCCTSIHRHMNDVDETSDNNDFSFPNNNTTTPSSSITRKEEDNNDSDDVLFNALIDIVMAGKEQKQRQKRMLCLEGWFRGGYSWERIIMKQIPAGECMNTSHLVQGPQSTGKKMRQMYSSILSEARTWLCNDLVHYHSSAYSTSPSSPTDVEYENNYYAARRWSTRALRLIDVYQRAKEEQEEADDNDDNDDSVYYEAEDNKNKNNDNFSQNKLKTFDSLLDLVGIRSEIMDCSKTSNDNSIKNILFCSYHLLIRLFDLLKIIIDPYERRCLLMSSNVDGPSFDIENSKSKQFLINVLQLCFVTSGTTTTTAHEQGLWSRQDVMFKSYNTSDYLFDLLLFEHPNKDTANATNEYNINNDNFVLKRLQTFIEQCCYDIIQQLSDVSKNQQDDKDNDNDSNSTSISLQIQVLDYLVGRLASKNTSSEYRSSTSSNRYDHHNDILMDEKISNPFLIKQGDELLYIVKSSQHVLGPDADQDVQEQEQQHTTKLVPVIVSKVHVEDLPNEPYFTIRGKGLTTSTTTSTTSNKEEERQTVASRLRYAGTSSSNSGCTTQGAIVVQKQSISNLDPKFVSCLEQDIVQSIIKPASKVLLNSNTMSDTCTNHHATVLMETLHILLNKCDGIQSLSWSPSSEKKQNRGIGTIRYDVFQIISKFESRVVSNIESILVKLDTIKEEEKARIRNNAAAEEDDDNDETAESTKKAPSSRKSDDGRRNDIVKLNNNIIASCETIESDLNILCGILGGGINTSTTIENTTILSEYDRTSITSSLSRLLEHSIFRHGLFELIQQEDDNDGEENQKLIKLFKHLMVTSSKWYATNNNNMTNRSIFVALDTVVRFTFICKTEQRLHVFINICRTYVQLLKNTSSDISSSTSDGGSTITFMIQHFFQFASPANESLIIGYGGQHSFNNERPIPRQQVSLEWRKAFYNLISLIQQNKWESLLWVPSTENDYDDRTINTGTVDENSYVEQLTQSLFDSQTQWFAYQILKMIIVTSSGKPLPSSKLSSSSTIEVECQNILKKEWSIGLPDEEVEELEEDLDIVINLFPPFLLNQLTTWYNNNNVDEDYKVGEDESRIEQSIGQLLTWTILLDWLRSFDTTSSSSAREKGALISFIQQTKAGRYILSLAYKYMPLKPMTNRSSSRKVLGGDRDNTNIWMTCMDFKGRDIADNDINNINIEHLATLVMFRTMQSLPTLAKLWWADDCGNSANNSSRRRALSSSSSSVSSSTSPRKGGSGGGGGGSAKEYVKDFVQDIVAPVTLKYELDQISSGVDGMEVIGNLAAREVVAVYEQDEMKLSVVIRLPSTFPLRNVEVDCHKTLGIPERRWRRWSLLIMRMLNHQDGNILEALMLWKTNVDKEFDGVEPCPVCYSIICPKTHTMPNLECRTCSNRFHSSCITKWFHSSNKTVCVMCQQQWNCKKVRY